VGLIRQARTRKDTVCLKRETKQSTHQAADSSEKRIGRDREPGDTAKCRQLTSQPQARVARWLRKQVGLGGRPTSLGPSEEDARRPETCAPLSHPATDGQPNTADLMSCPVGPPREAKVDIRSLPPADFMGRMKSCEGSNHQVRLCWQLDI
jgi:hypothetical protein